MKLLPAFVGAPERNRVYHVDALTLLRALPSGSVDAFILDLPYGTTACSWDEIIPFEPMWAEVKRTLKPRGVFVTTASQPFTSKLVMSNADMFRYEWIWAKSRAANFFNAKHRPLAKHENIVVFSPLPAANVENTSNYYPQGLVRTNHKWSRPQKYDTAHKFSRPSHELERTIEFSGYPESIIGIDNDHNLDAHPTQKPVALYEYLIRTYTQAGQLVVDFCCGSGTTALAARNLQRDFIAGDITAEYVEIARRRLAMPFTPNMFIDLKEAI